MNKISTIELNQNEINYVGGGAYNGVIYVAKTAAGATTVIGCSMTTPVVIAIVGAIIVGGSAAFYGFKSGNLKANLNLNVSY